MLHSKDVTKMKDFGKELAQTQDSVKDSVLNDVRKYITLVSERLLVLNQSHLNEVDLLVEFRLNLVRKKTNISFWTLY